MGGALIERKVAREVREEISLHVQEQSHLLAAELTRAGLPVASEAAGWANARGALTHARVTLIGADGRVLGDSSVPAEELKALENHRMRPEVLAAQQSGAGQA